MIILIAGAIVGWLAVCLFVVALCVVAKQGDAMTMEPEAQAPPVRAGRAAAAGVGGSLRLV